MIIVGIDEMDVRQYLVGTLICSLGWLLYRWNLQIVGTSPSARAGLKGHKTVQLANGAFYKAGSLRLVCGLGHGQRCIGTTARQPDPRI